MQQLRRQDRHDGSDGAAALVEFMADEIRSSTSAGASSMVAALREQYGGSIAAILFYGSCLRNGTDEDGLLDLYVLVDRYRDFYPGRGLAMLNALLPPNVFYMGKAVGDRTVRAKYAVMSVNGFVRLNSQRCFSSAFWARFAQPCAVLYVRDTAAEAAVSTALASAVTTFVQRVLPLMPDRFDALELWQCGLAASYATELRPERLGKANELVNADQDRYRRVTRLAVAQRSDCTLVTRPDGLLQIEHTISTRERRRGRVAWALRRVQGKLLNLLRLMKASLTFDGGVDYLLWKIERHSGIKAEMSPLARRYPLLGFWVTAWRLYRRGAFR
jgi:hypothetical protein